MTLMSAGGSVALGGLALLLWRHFAQERIAARIRIEPNDGIAVIEKVRLGGLEQWIQIAGPTSRSQSSSFFTAAPVFRRCLLRI